jgi:hypothetical protein
MVILGLFLFCGMTCLSREGLAATTEYVSKQISQEVSSSCEAENVARN